MLFLFWSALGRQVDFDVPPETADDAGINDVALLQKAVPLCEVPYLTRIGNSHRNSKLVSRIDEHVFVTPCGFTNHQRVLAILDLAHEQFADRGRSVGHRPLDLDVGITDVNLV